MKSKYLLIIILIFCGISESDLISQKKYDVTADDLRSWISYLASDEMRGRANGSPEMKVASDWIAAKFNSYGLKPFLNDDSYIQNYSYQSRQRSVNERNVIGVIEGTDPELKQQYIVLSAHFDHVGVRRNNLPDSIYNGADDNAAGTCTLIGIAKNIHDSGIKPGRSIIFAAFSGEENGMRGSRHFVENSPVDKKNIYVNLNFELTGHSESYGKNRYYMTGCNLSNLDELISEFNKNIPFILLDTVQMATDLFFGSDNISFSRISVSEGITTGIPSGTFATTTIAPHVHAPFDEGKLFDFDNMAGLVNHFTNLVIWLSDSKEEITWTDPKFSRFK